MSETDPYLYDDAAYVLGALDADERAAFEAHLVGCADCRARIAEVSGVPGLLAGLDAADLGIEAGTDNAPVPETLLPGLLRRAGRQRRRQRGLLAGLAAVAAACVVGLVIALWPTASSGPGTPAPSSVPVAAARDFVPLVDTPVRANASLVSTNWGTRIDVHCSYAAGVAKPFPYALRVIDADGDPDDLGSWTVPVGDDISYQTGTRYAQDEISKLEITKLDGTPILELTLH